jgi:D-alanyl-D-alanine carboxypeptidase/D-alanyl-D-alanine-endopeptidase (penicillin-binding protein 4)
VKRIIILPLLVLLLPTYVREPGLAAVAGNAADAAALHLRPLRSVSDYIDIIDGGGKNPDELGVLIETLGAAQPLAAVNPNVTFNPASVMKLATSLAALVRFGPDYRYRTNFLADGTVDLRSRTLDGDLVVEAGSDPMFSLYDADEVAAQLSRLGVSRVTGRLRIAGQFYYFANGYRSNLSVDTSAMKLRVALQKAGVRIEGDSAFGEKSGTLLLSHYSDPLASILLFQNAHSSNAIAEVVGASLGGPEAIQEYLVKQLGIAESDVFVGRASGLDFNRITPRATLKVLRALIGVLADHSLKPEDVMAVAGVDSGTLQRRLVREDIRGSVIAKTGTLVSIDNGVSTLVGIAYTRAHGPVLFAVFNTGGNVHAYRRLQDRFIEQLIAEEGGALPAVRNEDALADVTRHSIVQVLYAGGTQPVETAAE